MKPVRLWRTWSRFCFFNTYYVHNLLLTNEVVTMEEASDVAIEPLEPLALELEVVPVRRFTLFKKRKITELIN